MKEITVIKFYWLYACCQQAKGMVSERGAAWRGAAWRGVARRALEAACLGLDSADTPPPQAAKSRGPGCCRSGLVHGEVGRGGAGRGGAGRHHNLARGTPRSRECPKSPATLSFAPIFS